MYVKRLPYTEKLIVEIFGEYLFERDLTPPRYKLINSCQLAIPVVCRSMFFKLVNPMGAGNYSRLSNWIFRDTVTMKVRDRGGQWDMFASEQIINAISECRPTSEEIKEFRLFAADRIPKITIPDFFEVDEAIVAAHFAITNGSVHIGQVEWLNKYQFAPKFKATNLPLPFTE